MSFYNNDNRIGSEGEYVENSAIMNYASLKEKLNGFNDGNGIDLNKNLNTFSDGDINILNDINKFNNDIDFEKNINIKNFTVYVELHGSYSQYGVCYITLKDFKEIIAALKRNGVDVEEEVMKEFGRFFSENGKYIRVGDDFIAFVEERTKGPKYVPVYELARYIERDSEFGGPDAPGDSGIVQLNLIPIPYEEEKVQFEKGRIR